MEKLGNNFTQHESGLWIPENSPSVENKEAVKQVKLMQEQQELEAKKSDSDIADIIKLGKSGSTVHRPDGKFLSKHELEQIKANQDIIRENIGRQNNFQTSEAEKSVKDLDVNFFWKTKLALGNLLTGNGKFSDFAKRREEKRQKFNLKSREAWSQKEYGRAVALGSVAALASLGIATKLLVGARTAQATGITEGLVDSIRDFTQNAEHHLKSLEGSGLSDNDANYHSGEVHHRDRMSTEGLFDGTERNSKEVDAHVLEKIKNNPSLMSSVLEVRESGHMDKNFSLEDVNQRTHRSAVGGHNGEYSDLGEKNVETLEKSWNNGEQGKLLSEKQVNKILEKYEFINHGTSEGKYENAIDDTTYRAGKFDYRPDLGDQIYSKELGNGRVVFFKVNEQDPTRDCLNIQTLVERQEKGQLNHGGIEYKEEKTPENKAEMEEGKGHIPKEPTEKPKEQPTQPEESNPLEPTPTPTPEEKPPTGLTPKNPSEAPAGHDNGNHLAPTPELKPDTNIDGVTGGNPTNPQPEPTTPRAPENIPPVETNTETGQNANGNDGINDAPKNPSTGKPQQQNPNDI
jgi:hypothetical protein